MPTSIGVVIPTYQAAKHLPQCLPPLLNSPLKPRILVIDSSSTDGTSTIAKEMGAETLVIPQKEFNHGITREKGRQYLRTSILVMMTQDAYAISSDMLQYLIQPIQEKKASIAYGRQLPHKDAGFFGSFARMFNYPSTSHIRSLQESKTYGAYTFFCSNSCAAYSNEALDEIGGFPHVLFGEDTVVVAKLLHRGHRIAYVAEAQVCHSHDYTLKQEFCRHFDIGLSRHLYQNLLSVGGSDGKRGKAYTKALFKELSQKHPHLLPYAVLQTFAKFTGYQIGKSCLHASPWIKKKLSSQKYYWENN